MGCSQSAERVAPKPKAEQTGSAPAAEASTTSSLGQAQSLRRRASYDEAKFHAFLSHYKVEAATEARWLQEQLEPKLGGRAFLDRRVHARPLSTYHPPVRDGRPASAGFDGRNVEQLDLRRRRGQPWQVQLFRELEPMRAWLVRTLGDTAALPDFFGGGARHAVPRTPEGHLDLLAMMRELAED